MSRIVTETAASILAIFAGQTVTHETIGAQIELEYAMARKRCTFGSHVDITKGIERAGVVTRWTGFNYSGELLYAFPA
jgi:hypothetical protein